MPPDLKKQENKEKPNEIDLLKIGENDSKLPSPIDLNIRIAQEVELPSLKWNNADETPRLMKISNSGHSIIVTAKWFGPYRPYITGCQLPGTYIFSQAHFHWGKTDAEGSEHTTDGIKHPLELHVMYFKTDYGSPEKAMRELDGIVVLAYFYNLRKQPNQGLVPIINALPEVVQPYSSSPVELMPIEKLAPVFSNDFYSYWGSVYAQTNYKILWFIHREAQPITSQQLSMFREVIGANKAPLLSNFRDTKSINGRSLLFVNPGKIRDRTLIEAPPDPEEKENTPPPELKKSKSKTKIKNKSAVSGSVARRKSAKRKSSVRRQSKKESDKHHKSERPSVKRYEPSRRGSLKIRDDESQVHHNPRVLMTGVSFSMGDKDMGDKGGLSVGSSSESSSGTSTSSVSHCSDSKGNFDYDMESFQKRCELLMLNDKVEEDIPFVDISSLLGKGNINAKCEQLLNKLNICSSNKKETCMPILNDLEKCIMATVEKVANEKLESAKKMGKLAEEEDISAKGEGMGYINSVVKVLPPPATQEINATIKQPKNKELRTFKDFIEATREPESVEKNTEQPLHSLINTKSPPITVQQRCNSIPVERHTIQHYKCPQKQFAEICFNDTSENTGEMFCVVINNTTNDSSNAVQRYAPQSQVSQGLADVLVSRLQSDSNDTQSDSLQVEINSMNNNLWNNLPDLLSNKAVLTGLLQKVTTHPGVKFISNETMAMVTSSSTEDNNCSNEPPMTQNVSYLASQNTFMEIEDPSKSPTSSRLAGQKVGKLRRTQGSAVKHYSARNGPGLKRQTIITKIFQNRISNPRFVRTANDANGMTASTVARNRQEMPTPTLPVKNQMPTPTLRVKNQTNKPVWKY